MAADLQVGHRSRTVVAGVDLRVPRGTCTAIVGTNGCGKSTLLRTLAGLQPPLGGAIAYDGTALGELGATGLATKVAFMPQSPPVPVGVTVAELVAYGRHPHRRFWQPATATDAELVDEAMERASVGGLADRLVAHLSGGERQRVFLAMALAQSTPVLLLDEPTAALDVRHQIEVLRLLRSLVDDRGLAVGLVIHDLNHAAAVADQLLVIADQQVVARGTPHEVLTPSLVAAAFGVEARVAPDPDTGIPTCHFPLPRFQAPARPAAVR